MKEALTAIGGGDPIVLIVGRAGTGKTRLVQYLKALPGGELQATVAPTGIAALNAKAQTIHSFFRFPHVVLDGGNLQRGGNFGQLYRRMKRLVVDEISMVRADLIDAIDMRLRQVRGNDRPFGGVQLVMVGMRGAPDRIARVSIRFCSRPRDMPRNNTIGADCWRWAPNGSSFESGPREIFQSKIPTFRFRSVSNWQSVRG